MNGEFFINLEYDTDARYDFAKFLQYENNNFDPLTSKFLEELNTLEISGEYKVTTEEYRPELLSYYIYSDQQYWWILLEYNNLLSFEDLVTGLTISYPSLADLEALYFDLKAAETAKEA